MQFKVKSLIAYGLCALLLFILVRTLKFGSRENEDVETVDESTDPRHIVVGEQHFRRLSNAIQIKTVSWSITDFSVSALIQFQQFLKQEYPETFKSPFVSHELVGNYSMLLKVAGTDASLQPYLLMSHMDVVPAVSPEWTVDPFAGTVDSTYIWGRGAIDVKNTLMAIMEVLEVMTSSSSRPKRTFYVAFGHDEEVGGLSGARAIATLLQQRGIRFAFILDEGMAVVKDIVVPGSAALVGIGEKGLLTLRLSVNVTGGHSSAPGAESSLSVMAKAVARLSQSPHPHHFGYGAEVDMFQHLAPSFPFVKRVFISNLWLFGSVVAWMMCSKPETAAGIRTTTSVTIFRSGVKANVIPGYAEAIVNHRVHVRDSFEEVMQRNRDIIRDDRVRIETVEDQLPNHPPSPLSSTRTFGFSVIRKSVRQVFNNIPVSPALCIGNTDTRYFHALSDNVYRFTPTIFLPGDMKRFHGPNERITRDNYAQTVNFFRRVILNADASDADYERSHPPHDL